MKILRPARQEVYERLFAAVHTALMTNVLLAVSCAPLLAALAIVRDPPASWPFFAVLSLVCGPALAGAFGCFAALGQGSAGVTRTFWAAYRRAAPRALAVWAAGTAVVSVLAVDAVAVAGTAWGPVLVPFFCTAAALVVAVMLALVVLIAEPAAGRVRALLRPCLYLVARRWYLAAANLVVLGLAAGVILVKPVAGLLVVCSPLLYAVWATTRFVLAPILPAPGIRPAPWARPDDRPAGAGRPVSRGRRRTSP
ncbi:hypothetical protein [Nonomuraea sp. NPDC002799]